MAFLTDPANILYVGGSTDGAGSFRTGMKGDVAYVNMYSGSKSADEIQTLYNNAMTKGTTKAEIKTDPVDPVDPVDPDESADFNENNIVSRYAVMSDTHVRKTTDHTSNRLFENALKAAKTLTGGDLDAILLAGDLIEGYDEPEAESVACEGTAGSQSGFGKDRVRCRYRQSRLLFSPRHQQNDQLGRLSGRRFPLSESGGGKHG